MVLIAILHQYMIVIWHEQRNACRATKALLVIKMLASCSGVSFR